MTGHDENDIPLRRRTPPNGVVDRRKRACPGTVRRIIAACGGRDTVIHEKGGAAIEKWPALPRGGIEWVSCHTLFPFSSTLGVCLCVTVPLINPLQQVKRRTTRLNG